MGALHMRGTSIVHGFHLPRTPLRSATRLPLASRCHAEKPHQELRRVVLPAPTELRAHEACLRRQYRHGDRARSPSVPDLPAGAAQRAHCAVVRYAHPLAPCRTMMRFHPLQNRGCPEKHLRHTAREARVPQIPQPNPRQRPHTFPRTADCPLEARHAHRRSRRHLAPPTCRLAGHRGREQRLAAERGPAQLLTATCPRARPAPLRFHPLPPCLLARTLLRHGPALCRRLPSRLDLLLFPLLRLLPQLHQPPPPRLCRALRRLGP